MKPNFEQIRDSDKRRPLCAESRKPSSAFSKAVTVCTASAKSILRPSSAALATSRPSQESSSLSAPLLPPAASPMLFFSSPAFRTLPPPTGTPSSVAFPFPLPPLTPSPSTTPWCLLLLHLLALMRPPSLSCSKPAARMRLQVSAKKFMEAFSDWGLPQTSSFVRIYHERMRVTGI